MRNLKKILALVLALVMSMSMLATANAFTDDESIDETFTEAVEVLSGLKVFQGRPDGSFDPKAGITRAEVAAIIYRIVSKDVEDKQVSIYADYNKFSDVNSASWYAGYVNFCANGQYIKGHDGKFAPNDPVTGYQALAMILRALGYDANGEFTGSGWEVRTATIAKSLGITDNIAAGTLGTAASREVVAEILFRAILADTVSYQPAFGYVSTETSLGYENFGLEQIEGVVTANEYADLYDEYAIGEGKTRLETADKTYTLAVSTELTDLGENRIAYVAGKGGVKTVLTLVDAGNTVFETGAATDIEGKNFKKNTGMADAAEHFFNFDQKVTGLYESDYRIAFGNPDGVMTVVKAGQKITADQYAEIKDIFGDDDDDVNTTERVVYVGTQNDEDISDKISFKKFVKEYLFGADEQAIVEDTVNGDWLKVIDNDGDGAADYVFKTTFTMAQVLELTKKGVLTLTADEDNHELDETVVYGAAKTVPFVTSAELAAGDVVLHTVIDGVAYVELAPNFNGTVDKYTYKTEILTVEGEDYEQSGIVEHTGFEYEIENAEKKIDYTYYQDFFGYIRVFSLPAGADGELVLLTDGYYETNRKNDVYAVDAYLNDEIADYDVSGKSTGGFIDEIENNKNGWDKLVTFGEYNTLAGYTDATTNLARYSLNDENVMSLASAKTYTYDKRGNESGIKTDYVDLDEVDFAKGETDFPGVYNNPWKAEDGFLADRGEVIVQANKDTVYYYVSWVAGEPVIKTVVGYKNAIGVVDSVVGIESMYAVATNVRSDSKDINYWVADAIVIETEIPAFDLSSDVALGYNVLNKTVRDYAALESIMNDATLDTLNVTNVDGYNDFDKSDIVYPWFQFNTENEEGDSYIRRITANYAKYGIYVGTVDRQADLYEYVVAVGGDHLYFDADTEVYTLAWNAKHSAIEVVTEDSKGNELTLETGESYIFYAPKQDVVYAVLVEGADDVAAALYEAIEEDAAPKAPAAEDNLYKVTVVGETVEATGEGAGTKADPFTYVADVDMTNAAAKDWLVVEADDRNADVAIHYGSFDGPVEASGEGVATDDANTAIPAGAKWFVEVEGVYYTITVVDNAAASAAAIKSLDGYWTFSNYDNCYIYGIGCMFDSSVVDYDDIATIEYTVETSDGTVVASATWDESQVDAFVEKYEGDFGLWGEGQYKWLEEIPEKFWNEYDEDLEFTTERTTMTASNVFYHAAGTNLYSHAVVTMEDGTIYTADNTSPAYTQ